MPRTRKRPAVSPEVIDQARGYATLTMQDFTPRDHVIAGKIAERLGYAQRVYTSTSALWGLFCLPENPEHQAGPHRGGCIIHTRELGFLFVQDIEDLGLRREGDDPC